MAQALRGEVEIGLGFYAADFLVTRQRYDGFKANRASATPISPATPVAPQAPC